MKRNGLEVRTRKGRAWFDLVDKVKNPGKKDKLVNLNLKTSASRMAALDAMADHLHVTRTKVVCMLLDAALAETLAEVGEDVIEKLKRAGVDVDQFRKIA